MNFDEYSDSYFKLLEEQEKTFKFFAPDRYFFVKYKIDLLKKILSDYPKKILDYGSGVGLALPYFLENFPKSKIFASDISTNSLSVVSKNYSKVEVIRDEELTKKHFDLIYCSGVFHHIMPPKRGKVLRKLYKCLNKDGLICIFEHNPFNPITRRMVSTCEFDKGAELLSLSNLKKIMNINSFGVIKSNYTLFFPKIFSKLNFIEHYFGWCPLGGQYYVLAKKKNEKK
jgi:SAM-dependent methyltransferase